MSHPFRRLRRGCVAIALTLSVGALTPVGDAIAAGATSPPPRGGMGMAYDAARGETVLFGGSGLNDTWTWDGTTWTKQHPAISPPGRTDMGMTYDAARGEVVVFGGVGAAGLLNDTWTWDGTTWTQEQPANSPIARYGMGMTYDAARGEVVLFGGFEQILAAPGGGTSTNRSKRSLVARKVPALGLNDTWTWDGSNWTHESPATSPSGRMWVRMTYDVARGKVLLFGGYDGNGCCLGDTWTWDGTTWTEQHPTTSPPGRHSAATQYDAEQAEVVLFGGFTSQSWDVTGDTWTWDGSNWTEQHPASSPTARGDSGTAYDPAGGEVLLFGGHPSGCCPAPPVGDTWAWNGTTWSVPLIAHLHLSPNSGPPGTVVQVKGTGFAAFERVTIRFVDSVIGKTGLQKVKSDATGAVTTQVTVPADATVGVQRITASGWRSGQHAKAKFTVT